MTSNIFRKVLQKISDKLNQKADKSAVVDLINNSRKNLLDTSLLPDRDYVSGSIDIQAIHMMNNNDGSLTFTFDADSNITTTQILVWNCNEGLPVASANGQIAGNIFDGVGEYVVDIGDNGDNIFSLQIITSDVVDSNQISVAYNRKGINSMEYKTQTVYAWVRVSITSGTYVPAGSYTIRPMICKKSLYDIDSTYKHYVPSNAKLALKRTVITGTTSANGNLELTGLMYNKVVVVSVTEQLTTGDYKCAYTPAVNNDKWTTMCRYFTHPDEIPAEVEKTVVVYYYEI